MKNRYYSLDVFRGATVALMILVNNPGSWSHIYPPFAHAPWHGCTPTDLVFPFFLFAVGNAMAFVMPRLQKAGAAVFWKKVLKRFLLIFLIGLFLNWSPFLKWSGDSLMWKHWVDPLKPETGIRILGVLQRIAICYLLASIIAFYTKPAVTFIICSIILLMYWWISYATGLPGDPYSLTGFVGTKIDLQLLGIAHVYKGEGVPFDPEGLFSTLPAVVQVIFGFFTGQYIIEKSKAFVDGIPRTLESGNMAPFQMLSLLLIAGIVLTASGLIWDGSFPINKKIWTSSYTLYTSGLAIITIGVMIYLLEFKQIRGGWTRFFDVFGKNPLFIFVLSGLLPRIVGLFRWTDHIAEDGSPVYTMAFSWFYTHICAPISTDPRNGSLLYALCTITFYWLLAWVLDKKKIYIKV